MTNPEPHDQPGDAPSLPPKRPVGVTLAAVVAFIGSGLVVFFGLLFALASATQQSPPGAPDIGVFGVAMGIIMLALGVLGVSSAVGVLRLRPWARMSMLVFAGITAAFTFAGGAVIAISPMPRVAELPPGAETMLRPLLLTLYGIPLLICLWWLVQFNTAASKAAFAGRGEADTPTRPLMIAVIGWFNVVGGIFCIAVAVAGGSAFVAGFALEGWGATLYYVFLGAVNTFLGWRLLQLDERARILTIWWFAINILHTGFIALSPGARARLRELQVAVQPEGATSPFDTTAFSVLMLGMTALLLAGAIWPLVTAKSAFRVES